MGRQSLDEELDEGKKLSQDSESSYARYRMENEEKPSDEIISHQIYLFIYQIPGAEIKDIQVTVNDGNVTLKGQIPTDEHQMKLRNWIKQVRGVNQVVTELIVLQ